MSKSSQHDQAEAFHALHQSGTPLVLVNAWDPWSARTVAEAGSLAIATSSYAVAEAAGYADGQNIPFAEMLHIVTRICASVDLPVTADIEAGFGDDAASVRAKMTEIIRAGAIGVNIEDGQHAGKRGLVDPALHAAKIAALREAGNALGVRIFINTRTDTFLLNKAPSQDTVTETLRRAAIYREAGADGLFVPGLVQPNWIEHIAAQARLPLNIMLSPDAPSIAELSRLGVARISLAIWPFEFVRAQLKSAVTKFRREGDAGVFLQRS